MSQAPLSHTRPPWLSIWRSPRSTIRRIVQGNPRQGVIPLALIWGASTALSFASVLRVGDKLPLGAILPAALIGGAALGLPAFYILGGLYTLSGRVFGGTAKATEMRAALAWSSVPMAPTLLIWALRIALFGQDLFASNSFSGASSHPLLFGITQVASLPLSVWAVAIWLGAYSEVHQVSTWRGIASLAISGAVIGAGGAALLVVCIPVTVVIYAIAAMLFLSAQGAG